MSRQPLLAPAQKSALAPTRSPDTPPNVTAPLWAAGSVDLCQVCYVFADGGEPAFDPSQFPRVGHRYSDPNSDIEQKQAGDNTMFMDEVVLAGIVIVILTAGFLGGFGYFVWKDAHKGSKTN